MPKVILSRLLLPVLGHGEDGHGTARWYSLAMLKTGSAVPRFQAQYYRPPPGKTGNEAPVPPNLVPPNLVDFEGLRAYKNMYLFP